VIGQSGKYSKDTVRLMVAVASSTNRINDLRLSQYLGAQFAKQGVVLVAANYRVGGALELCL